MTDQIHYEMTFLNSSSCFISFGNQVSEAVSDRVIFATKQLQNKPGVVDLISSYTSLLVTFNPGVCHREKLQQDIELILSTIKTNGVEGTSGKEVIIPVYYDVSVAPDLAYVAEQTGLDIEKVIELHTAQSYRAYAIGFSLGYAFLGTLPEALRLPRKTTPRLKVPKGSVAIAEKQTAVYPSETPGGWHLIGRTPTDMVDWQSDSLSLIAVGDRIQFRSVSKAEFLELGGVLDGV